MFHWTDDGVASWYEFAVAIAKEGIAAGLLDPAVVVKPIASSGYPTAAQRPRYSVLDTSSTIASLGLETVHWRKWLRAVMQEAAIG